MANQVSIIAVGGTVDHYDLLGTTPVEQWSRIQKALSAEWKTGDQTRLSAMSGCLEKLSTSLLQVHRIRGFHQELINTALQNLGKNVAYFALRGDIACADFESLLLQGRAALDRLTWLVSREFKQSCHSFRKLSGILENFQNKSERARNLLNVVREVSPWITGLFAKIETGDSFRDFVAHKGATTEKMTNCFGINYLDKERALLLDCELERFPLFRTSFESVQYLSFTVLNTLAIFIGQPPLPLTAFECKWRPQTAVLSEFVISEPENSPLKENHLTVVMHMHPDGLVTATRNVKPDLFSHAVHLASLNKA
jgi:hypothetical protein